MTDVRALLLAHLSGRRRHVLSTVEGLGEDDLDRALLPSGWTFARMLAHLAVDDELFWFGAILGGDPDAIADVQDGWQVPLDSPAAAVERYRAEIVRSDAILEAVALDEPPRWWPPADVFAMPAMESGWEVVVHVLAETAIHAGHLDAARELLDGHQHLVL